MVPLPGIEPGIRRSKRRVISFSLQGQSRRCAALKIKIQNVKLKMMVLIKISEIDFDELFEF